MPPRRPTKSRERLVQLTRNDEDPSLFDQPPPPVLDLAESKRRRDVAVASVERNAHEDWKVFAYETGVWCQANYPIWSSDDLAARMIAVDSELANSVHDWRALGPIVNRLVREERIAPTGEFRSSARPALHACPRRMWRSL